MLFRRSALKKWASFLLAFVMIFAILPAPGADADTAIFFQLENLSTDPDAPTQVNSSVLDLVGTYQGVSTDTISFRVDVFRDNDWQPFNIGTGISPILTGTNGFRFLDVEIATGLNRITVFAAEGANQFFVYFPNVPTIYDIRLANGAPVPAGQFTVVDYDEITLTLKAPNATSVTVQGIDSYPIGSDEFIATNIPLEFGLNRLVFVASNNTNTYSVTRDVVLTQDGFAVYSAIFGDKVQDPLDDNPTFTSNSSLVGAVKGYIAVRVDPADPDRALSASDLQVNIYHGSSSAPLPNSGPVKEVKPYQKVSSSVTGTVYDFNIFEFVTEEFTLNTYGNYVVEFAGEYGDMEIEQFMFFQYKSENTPLIREFRLLHNPTVQSDGRVSYTGSSRLTDNQFFFNTPIWVAVHADQFDLDDAGYSASIASSLGAVTATQRRSVNDELVFEITNLPAGEQTITITLAYGAGGPDESDSRDVDLVFVPTPFIDLNELYNGKQFTRANQFKEVSGRLVNFDLSNPANRNVTITINGTTRTVTADAAGAFSLDTTTHVTLGLVNGPNTIVVSAQTNGVPVSTTLTVFLFPDNLPGIVTLSPVVPGASGTDTEVFQPIGNDQFNTTAKRMEVLFSVTNATQVIVSVDGQQYVKTNDSLQSENGNRLVSDSSMTNGFRVLGLELPGSGTMSVTITAVAGTTSASRTLMVTRTPVAFELLSPKLPEEAVINQNFLEISIRAEGADAIILDKQQMVKDANHDIFRLTYDKLKRGKNTIKFTIVTGEREANYQFEVTYAYQNEVGAQYRTTIPSSGKLNKLFDGQLTLTFPKDTMLKKPENIGGGSPFQVELINNQPLLFGIADPIDGRTVKRYNRVGEVQNGVPRDGELAVIGADSTAKNFLLNNRDRRGFASHLFWIDAGYLDTNNKLQPAKHPYAGSDRFYNRAPQTGKWLEPTKRGEITLAYDPNIRDEAARNLAIGHHDGRNWHILGGTVNTKQKTVKAPFNGFGYYAVLYVRYGFEDVVGHPYARNYLDAVYAKGIMDPISEKSTQFGVYDNVTRGEFATMMVKILDLPLNYSDDRNELTFNDVRPEFTNPLWDYRYIETAARAGIVSGLQPRVFNPNGPITREQAASMIARGLNLKLGTVEKDRNALAKVFDDVGQMDHYFIPAIQAVHKAKIMSGSPITLDNGDTAMVFRPKAHINRADMAIVAYNIMTMLKKF